MNFLEKTNYVALSELSSGRYHKEVKCFSLKDKKLVMIKVYDFPKNDNLIFKEDIDEVVNDVEVRNKCKSKFIRKSCGVFKSDGLMYVIDEFIEGSVIELLKFHSDVSRVKEFSGTIRSVKMNDHNSFLIALSYCILNGMLQLHKSGVIHRNIRGSSIMITRSGEVKLCGMEWACDKHESKKFSKQFKLSYKFKNNMFWFSPELISYSDKCDKKSDVWSFGMLLLEIIHLKHPYEELDTLQWFNMILLGDCSFKLPDKLVNTDICKLLKKCLIRDREKRPSVKELLKMKMFKKVKTPRKIIFDSLKLLNLPTYLERKRFSKK